MIGTWNRKKLLTTFSMEKQNRVMNALNTAGIECAAKGILRDANVMGGSAMTRQRMGGFKGNPDYGYEYRVYVRKEDMEQALAVVKAMKEEQ